VIVAVLAVGVVQMTIDQVVVVVAVRDGLVPAVWPVNVPGLVSAAIVVGGTGVGMSVIDRDPVLVDVSFVGMVQVAVVQIVDVVFVAHGNVTAVIAVGVLVSLVDAVVLVQLFLRSSFVRDRS
jgi:hypothetical protein